MSKICGFSSLGEILLLGDTVVPLSWKLKLPPAALAPYAFEYAAKGENLCELEGLTLKTKDKLGCFSPEARMSV